MPYITVGTDLEVFGKRGEHHVALCGKIGGSKEAPLQLPDMHKGFMVQEDNVSLEFNVPASDSAAGFTKNISVMRERVFKILNTLGLSHSTHAAVSFDKQELTHPNALVFGCEPDYNAWTKRENEKPRSKDACLRTAGGHVHVGTSDVDMLEGIKYMDLFLGVPSILLDDSESSVRRRELYGKAGAMRPKPYGFEYRTLSNFWMFSDKLVNWVFNNTMRAMESACIAKDRPDRGITSADGILIQECINTGDKKIAEALIAKYKVPMPRELPEESKEPLVRDALLRKLTGLPPTAIGWAVALQGTNIGIGVNTILGTLDEEAEEE